ncbi:hypothetical protein JOF28_000195 [Leucobacter exalbidus]|uniref:Uncharacterized protein n=1 Tax=Leucobacter exalbidus TaxID=662960 RepID=A0A940T2M7_9MICO|nr:hypothetical protein [Leucobacter exalbidus]MBP1324963.1 hypothetical protein [Leucobacter exalbidus]
MPVYSGRKASIAEGSTTIDTDESLGGPQPPVVVRTDRLRGAQLAGVLVAVGIAWAASIVIALGTKSVWAFVPSGVLLLGLLCLLVLARASVRIDAHEVRFRAPFYSRTLQRTDITEVVAAPDDGLPEGSVSWFITRHDNHTRTRINFGGSASVTVTGGDGRRVQLVVRDLATAQRIAEIIRR